MSVSGNTIITSFGGFDCPDPNYLNKALPVAVIYEKDPVVGWVNNVQPTAKLKLDLETEIDANTQYCSIFNNTYKNVDIAGKYAFVRVALTNGSSTVDRIFVYRKRNEVWRSDSDVLQDYKINANRSYEFGDDYELHGTDILHSFFTNQFSYDEGRIEVISLEDYCFSALAYIRLSFTLNGKQADVSANKILLGGGPSGSVAAINSDASINYMGRAIVLKPGFKAINGSSVIIKSSNCDDQYWIDGN